MASYDQNNMDAGIGLGFKGNGAAQAVGVYNDRGALMLGGYAALLDAQVVRFGRLASVNPAGNEGEFFMGIPSNYVPMGLVIYEAGLSQNDPSRLGTGVTRYLQGQPMTVMQFGQMWMARFTTLALGAIQPILGAVVCINNTTGDVEFLPKGTVANPTGYTITSSISVKSVSLDTNGAMLLVSF